MKHPFVTIATYHMPHEAHVAKFRLEEEGIPAVILDNNMSSLYGGLVEIRLQVPEEDAEDALDILETELDEAVDLLEDIGGDEFEYPEDLEQAHDWKERPARHSQEICPRCGSQNSLKTVPGPVPGWLNALLLGTPGLFFPARQQCRGCGNVFR